MQDRKDGVLTALFRYLLGGVFSRSLGSVEYDD